MARLDPSAVEVHVFTFKEGLLSAVAHDLDLKVGRCTVDADGDTLRAEFDTSSLQVVSAMKDGAASEALSSSMKAEIEKNVVHDVLESRRHPTARFETKRVDAGQVEGALTLHGVTRPVRGARRSEGSWDVAEFRFDQRDFGIKPYSAMLGTLKIKPEVLVRVKLKR